MNAVASYASHYPCASHDMYPKKFSRNSDFNMNDGPLVKRKYKN